MYNDFLYVELLEPCDVSENCSLHAKDVSVPDGYGDTLQSK